jgi:hypothetical protein
MAKRKEKFMQSSRSTWLKLTLELIAVFVGIMAGFFVNSYQENKKDRELEGKYLESFHKNLLVDSAQIKMQLAEDQNNLDISRRAAFTMTTAKLPRDSALVVLSVIATFNNLNMQDATYESIVNSGNLGLIRDWELREELVNYYRYQQTMRDVEEVYNEYIVSYVMPSLFESVDLISGELAEDFRTDSREFKNLTAGYYSLANQKMEVLHEIDSVNHALIATLRKLKE